VLGERAQGAVPGDLLEYREGAALVLQLPDAGVAELVEGPSGGVGEALSGPPVGRAGPAGGGVPVGGRHPSAGAAAGEEERAVCPPGGEPGEQVGGVGVPVDLAGDAALARYDGCLGVQVEVREAQAEQLADPGGGVVGPTYDDRPKRRLFEVLAAQGMAANQAVTFLTDGADDVRDLPRYLNPDSEHLIDWFHVTMRLTVLAQVAKSLPGAALAPVLCHVSHPVSPLSRESHI